MSKRRNRFLRAPTDVETVDLCRTVHLHEAIGSGNWKGARYGDTVRIVSDHPSYICWYVQVLPLDSGRIGQLVEQDERVTLKTLGEPPKDFA